MMKGVNQLLAAVFMVVIAVAMAALIGSWLSSFSADSAQSVKNTTKSELECQFADIFVKNASYNCTSDCAAGVNHNLTVVVVNSGKIKIGLDTIYIQNKSGYLFAMPVNYTQLDVGSVVTLSLLTNASCNGINRSIEKIIVSSGLCPNTAYDSIEGDQVNFLSC